MKNVFLFTLLSIALFNVEVYSQIEISSTGHVGIGTTPDSYYELILDGRSYFDSPGAANSFSLENYDGEAVLNTTINNWGFIGSPSRQLWQIWTNQLYLNGSRYTSDERMKKNIKDMDSTLKKIQKVKCVKYDRKIEEQKSFTPEKKNDIEKSSKNLNGYLAQDLMKNFPELVEYNKKSDVYYVDYVGMIPVLTNW